MAEDLGIASVGPAERLGSGGFGTVYRAEQLGMQRFVAVKVLPSLGGDSDSLRRFERERQALGSVADHPHIVSVFDWGVAGDRPYLVMELLPGGTLAELVARSGVLSPATVCGVGVAIADALAAAHERGVLHRDVKPENILISAYGQPVLCDFGIARLAGASRTVGGALTASLAHAAPEVVNGQEMGAATDIWSLASTLVTLASGRPPFISGPDDSMPTILARILTQDPPDLVERGVPEDLARVLRGGLTKDVEARTASASVFRDELKEVAAANGWGPVLLPTRAVETPPASSSAASSSAPTSVSAAEVFSPFAAPTEISGGRSPVLGVQGGSSPVTSGTVIVNRDSGQLPGGGPPPPPPVLTPAPVAPKSSKAPWIVAAVAAVVMFGAIGTAVGVMAAGGKDQVSAGTTTTGPTDTSTSTSSSTSTTSTTTTTPTPFNGVPGGNGRISTADPVAPAAPPTPSPEVQAKAEMDRIVAGDRSAVAGVLDQWVPQVSAKKSGLRDKLNGVTYTWQTSLQDYQAWKSKYSDALLLLSNEYSTFESPGFYITIVPRTFGSGTAATSWCRSEGLAVPDRCLGKVVSRTRGTSGATQTT